MLKLGKMCLLRSPVQAVAFALLHLNLQGLEGHTLHRDLFARIAGVLRSM